MFEVKPEENPTSARRDVTHSIGQLSTGLGFGVVCFWAAFFVLVWAEARIHIGGMIEHAPNLNMDSSRDGIAATYTGVLSFARPADDELLNGDYGYIVRVAETCSWTELSAGEATGDNESGYQKMWVVEVPDSDSFRVRGHDNIAPTYKERISQGTALRVGDYELGGELTEFVGAQQITPARFQVAQARFVDGPWAYDAQDQECSDTGGAIIGDQRFTFYVLSAGEEVTVFGKKSGGSLLPAHNQFLMAHGNREALVSHFRNAGSQKIWLFRGLGALLLWVSIYLIVAPGMEILATLPLIREYLRPVGPWVKGLLALLLTSGFVFLGWGMRFFTNLFGGLVG